MCKPHKELARDIATIGSLDQPDYNLPRSADQRFDPARYYVAMVAMSALRTEQVMPALYGDSCYDPATLVTSKAQSALAEAALPVNKSCPHATLRSITAFRDSNIGTLRSALDDLTSFLKADGSDLTLKSLGVPSLPDDPKLNGPFLDEATVHLFTGYDDKEMTVASKPLKLSARPPKPEFDRLHQATAYFIAQSGVQDILKQMFAHKLVQVIRKAPEEVKLGLGQQIDCHMCHHADVQPGVH